MAIRRRVPAATGADQDNELQRLIREQRRDDRGAPLPIRLSPSSDGGEHDDDDDDLSEVAGAHDDGAASERPEIEDAFADTEMPLARARRDGASKVREERALADYGTGRASQQERERKLFHRHVTRLTIIDPVVATIAAMRWSRARRLTLSEIAELTGRAEKTIEQDLKATRSRLALLGLFPPPAPATTYRPARDAGLSARAAGFAFWLSYTVSAERAAELTGYGRSGASDARKSVIRQLAKAGENDARLAEWSASLDEMKRKSKEIRKSGIEERSRKLPDGANGRSRVKTSQASTMLGKRRSGLQPTVAPGQMPKPILWLDQIDEDVPDVAVDLDMVCRRAIGRHLRLDGDPVEILADALEHDPAHVIDLALMLAQRDAPYFDTFRDQGG